MSKRGIQALSAATIQVARQTLQSQGYVHISGVFSLNLVQQVLQRFEPLFRGEFDTQIYPDEWHWREGISRPDAPREICNAWKADRTIASVILNEAIGAIIADITSWDSVRIAQDDVIWKPPASGAVGYHRDCDYISEQFTHTRNNSVTVWMPLEDTDELNGTIEYAPGSHKWNLPSNLTFHGTGLNYREPAIQARSTTISTTQPPIKFQIVPAKAGDIVIHHQDTWHGSAPNQSTDRHRRTLVGHYLRGDAEFRLGSAFADRSATATAPAAVNTAFYIYGRYRRPETSQLDELFFPIIYSKTGARTSWLDSFIQRC